MAPRNDRRQQILTQACAVFARKGYHGTTVDDIVEATGIARGTFYLYFSDKRAAFDELVARLFTRLAMNIQHVDVDRPVIPQIEENIRRILQVALEEREITTLLVTRSYGGDPELDLGVRNFFREIEKLLIESLLDGQQRGLVRPGGAQLLAFFTLGGLKEVLFQISNGALTAGVEDLVATITSLLQTGLLIL